MARTRNVDILAVVSVRRLGLRFKFNHTFLEYCSNCKATHQHEMRELSSLVKLSMKEYAKTEKDLYFFSSKGEPLNGYKEIGKMKLKVVVVDSSPRLQLSSQLSTKI